MTTRTKEEDALEEMTLTLNQAISNQADLAMFGDAAAKFVSKQFVNGVKSKMGESNYSKVSTIMSAVISHITTQSTQELVTQEFNKFILMLREVLRLEGLAQQLEDKLKEVKVQASLFTASGNNPSQLLPSQSQQRTPQQQQILLRQHLGAEVSRKYPKGSHLKVFNQMLPTMRNAIAGSMDGLCLDAIARMLMTHPEKAGILEGGTKFSHASRFLEHFALKIEVEPPVLFQFTSMLKQLGTCDGVVQEVDARMMAESTDSSTTLQSWQHAWQSQHQTHHRQQPLANPHIKQRQLIPNQPLERAAITPEVQAYDEKMTVDQLCSWLLHNGMPSDDCQIFKDQKVNGVAFRLCSADDWDNFGFSRGGLIVLKKKIMKLVPSSGHESDSARNGSTSSKGSTNGSSHSGRNNGSAMASWRTAPSGGSGRITDEEVARSKEILKLYSHKWRSIGEGLGFKASELDSIVCRPLLLLDAPYSYLSAMLSEWHQWAPADYRGSNTYATLHSLKIAVDKAGLGLTAQEL